MKMNEVIKEVGLSKRAVKYYEEEGLLTVKKDKNGYRNYSDDDVRTLKKISVYRKLGISIKDIKRLLANDDRELLRKIYEEKKCRLGDEERVLDSLASYIDDMDIDAVYEDFDYQSVADALKDMIPGAYGRFFMYHFLPYLQIKITTQEQRKAYGEILDFFDHLEIKIPAMLRLGSWLTSRISKDDPEHMAQRMDRQIKSYMEMS